MKKIFLFLLFFFNQNTLFSMEEDVDSILRVVNINSQDEHGTTPVLRAASYANWNLVDGLLKHGADKTIKDNYGQSLFSKAFHDTNHPEEFNTLLQQYTSEEINAECKSMPLRRDTEYQVTPAVQSLLQATLDGKVLKTFNQQPTARLMACNSNHIPYILHFLKRNKNFAYPYKLSRLGKAAELIPLTNKTLFVLREAFNNGSCLPYFPAFFIRAFFEKCPTEYLLPEVTKLIEQKYMLLLMQDLPKDYLKTAEAFLWRPVCSAACALIKAGDIHEGQRLTRILLMSQKEKTKLNIKLFLKDQEKEHAQK